MDASAPEEKGYKGKEMIFFLILFPKTENKMTEVTEGRSNTAVISKNRTG